MIRRMIIFRISLLTVQTVTIYDNYTVTVMLIRGIAMKKGNVKLTIAQFAKLHNVNKRTLHYYDSIGLFSPNTKGENGYRYYDLSQSIDFEYIRMLKELNVSIDEIQDYINQPNQKKFIELANKKERELEIQIKKLKSIKQTIQTKRVQAELCETIEKSKIEMVECRKERLLILPYDFSEDISNAFSYMKDSWSLEQIRMGVGGMIAAEKVLQNNFSSYDCIYTPALSSSSSKHTFYKPEGMYICYYHKGEWDTLPFAYQNIISFAQKNGLKLVGYAYEIGLNEFAISEEQDYITKIMVKAE